MKCYKIYPEWVQILNKNNDQRRICFCPQGPSTFLSWAQESDDT